MVKRKRLTRVEFGCGRGGCPSSFECEWSQTVWQCVRTHTDEAQTSLPTPLSLSAENSSTQRAFSDFISCFYYISERIRGKKCWKDSGERCIQRGSGAPTSCSLIEGCGTAGAAADRYCWPGILPGIKVKSSREDGGWVGEIWALIDSGSHLTHPIIFTVFPFGSFLTAGPEKCLRFFFQ